MAGTKVDSEAQVVNRTNCSSVPGRVAGRRRTHLRLRDRDAAELFLLSMVDAFRMRRGGYDRPTLVITCELPQAEFARDQIQGYGPDWRMAQSKGRWRRWWNRRGLADAGSCSPLSMSTTRLPPMRLERTTRPGSARDFAGQSGAAANREGGEDVEAWAAWAAGRKMAKRPSLAT